MAAEVRNGLHRFPGFFSALARNALQGRSTLPTQRRISCGAVCWSGFPQRKSEVAAYTGSRLELCRPTASSCRTFATLAMTEKDLLKRDLLYSHVLFKLEGMDEAILDNFSQFIAAASGMLDLTVSKQFNLTTESFSQTLANTPDSYKDEKVTYSFKRHGRMLEIKELPSEVADTFLHYIQRNTPEGVYASIELKTWQDYVSPPDPRILEERRLALKRKLELRQLKKQK